MTAPAPDPERIAQGTLQLCQVDSTTGQEARLIPLLTGLSATWCGIASW